MSKEKWSYQIGENEIWINGGYDSKEDAISGCKEDYDSEERDKDEKCYVGRYENYRPYISAYRVISDIQEDACEECGEVADKFLDNVMEERGEELDNKLNEVLNEWLTKHNLMPTFGNMIYIEEIQMD